MKALDALLVLAAVLATAAGWLIAPPLGLALAAVACVAIWFLFGEVKA